MYYDDWKDTLFKAILIILAVVEVLIIGLGLLVGACAHAIISTALAPITALVTANFVFEMLNVHFGLFGRWLDYCEHCFRIREKYIWVALFFWFVRFFVTIGHGPECFP